MRYYPKLKIFKSSNGNNTFDGKLAHSYEWYCYGMLLSNGDIVEVEKSYSNTTTQHMYAWRNLIDSDRIKYRISAPEGLTDLGAAKESIEDEIAELNKQLANPRNRARQRRIDRIAQLEKQLALLPMLAGELFLIQNKGEVA